MVRVVSSRADQLERFSVQLQRVWFCRVVSPTASSHRLPNGRPQNGQLLYEVRKYADPCPGTSSTIETVAMPTESVQAAILAARSGDHIISGSRHSI